MIPPLCSADQSARMGDLSPLQVTTSGMLFTTVFPARRSARQVPAGSGAFELIELVTTGALGLVATPRSLPPGRYQATLSGSFAVGIVWNRKCTNAAFVPAGMEARGPPVGDAAANAIETTPWGGAASVIVRTWVGTTSLPLWPAMDTTNPPGRSGAPSARRPGRSLIESLNGPAGSDRFVVSRGFEAPDRCSCSAISAAFA